MSFIVTILESIIGLFTQITGSLFSGVPGQTVDCSGWVPAENWPDRSPVEWLPVCGQEHWTNPVKSETP